MTNRSSFTADNRSSKQRNTWLLKGIWLLLITGGGFVFWRVAGFFRRLFRQPLLPPNIRPEAIEVESQLEKRAQLIAIANLRSGIERRYLPDGRQKLVLCAGMRNFRELWARDFGFASFGLLALGETKVTRESLEVFLFNQRPSGQFPVKIHSTNIVERYLHSFFKREQPILKPLRPKYITAHNTISLDGNALLVVATLNYAAETGDTAFVRSHWEALKRAAAWLEVHALEADGLLHQAAFADWADSIGRSGRILYTNVLYWKALVDLQRWAERLAYTTDQRHFAARAGYLKRSLNNYFWRDDLGYYVTSDQFDNLSSSGNLLAIAWQLTTPEQAHSILDRMAEFEMANPVPTRVVHRPYPVRFIALENRLGGIPNYHTSAAWLWLGAWHVIALARMDRLQEAGQLRRQLASVIDRDGAVHEVYSPEGFYLSSFWYTSEAPLTWSAGLIVYANYVYQQQQVPSHHIID